MHVQRKFSANPYVRSTSETILVYQYARLQTDDPRHYFRQPGPTPLDRVSKGEFRGTHGTSPRTAPEGVSLIGAFSDNYFFAVEVERRTFECDRDRLGCQPLRICLPRSSVLVI